VFYPKLAWAQAFFGKMAVKGLRRSASVNWCMSLHGIVPFTRGQHQINLLYGKVTSDHRMAPPVQYLNPCREGTTGLKYTKVARDLLHISARNHAKFHRAQSNDVW